MHNITQPSFKPSNDRPDGLVFVAYLETLTMNRFMYDSQSPGEPGAAGEGGTTGEAQPHGKPDSKTRTSKGYFKGTKLESMNEDDEQAAERDNQDKGASDDDAEKPE